MSPLPTAHIYPIPVGILFPGFNVAAGVNAAALPLMGKGTSVQGAYLPALSSGDPNGYFGSVAMASKTFGFGIGLLGSKSGSTTTNSLFTGAGFHTDNVAFGLGLRDPNVHGGFNPEVDAGVIVGGDKGLTFGFNLYHLQASPRLAAGLGFIQGRKYNLEANVLLPSFSNFNKDYVITASASIFADDVIGFNFCESYYTINNTFLHTIGVLVWVSQHVNLIAQFTSQRTLAAGLSVVF